MSAQALATVYKSYIRFKMEYCCPMWMGAGSVALAALDRIQVRAIRVIGHTEGVKLQSLAHRRGVAALAVMHRLMHLRAPEPLHRFIPRAAPTRHHSSTRSIAPALERPNVRLPARWLRSCLPLLTFAWNRVPAATRAEPNPQVFKETVNVSMDLTFLNNFVPSRSRA